MKGTFFLWQICQTNWCVLLVDWCWSSVSGNAGGFVSAATAAVVTMLQATMGCTTLPRLHLSITTLLVWLLVCVSNLRAQNCESYIPRYLNLFFSEVLHPVILWHHCWHYGTLGKKRTKTFEDSDAAAVFGIQWGGEKYLPVSLCHTCSMQLQPQPRWPNHAEHGGSDPGRGGEWSFQWPL